MAISIIKLSKNIKKRLFITHQVRKNELNEVKNIYNKASLKSNVISFIEDISSEMKRASLVISRSGASTVYENAVVGVPSVYFPISDAPADHQYKNALIFQKKKAAWIFERRDLENGKFIIFLNKTLLNRKTLERFAENNRDLAKPEATKKIKHLIMELVNASFR